MKYSIDDDVIGSDNDYVITTERLSWLKSLHEFHKQELDDITQDDKIKQLESDLADLNTISEELDKKLKDAQKVQLPLDQAHEELTFKVNKAKIAVEKEEALRKETEISLRQDMQLALAQIIISREETDREFKTELDKKEKEWERERRKMAIEREACSERLLKAESAIKEMTKSRVEQMHMKKEHCDQMVRLKAQLKVDEEKWRVEIEKIQGQQTKRRNELRSKEKLWAEELKATEHAFRKEMALKEMNWKTERQKLLKRNRILALKSNFIEHWIKDLEKQIRAVGAEILEKKKSLTAEIQMLEEKCIVIMRDQDKDPEPFKQLVRTNLNLADMMPSANGKNSVWKVVDGWK